MQKQKVFLVDDDAMFLNMLFDALENVEGVDLEMYGSGELCIKALYKKPAIILLDHNFQKSSLNAIDGLEALKRIKKIQPDVIVIMLSGQENPELVYEFVQQGAHNYIMKDEDVFENAEIAISEALDELKEY